MKISERFICENVTFNTGVIGTTTHSKLGANYEEYLPKKKEFCMDYHDFTGILGEFW